MGNFKVKVNTPEESKEAQELAFKLGATLGNGDHHAVMVPGAIGLAVIDGLINFVFSEVVPSSIAQAREITLPELRAMVKPMKEYLDANRNYEFVLSTEKDDGFIEIPEGAIRARFYPHDPDELEFENAFHQWWHGENNEWISYENYSNTLEHSRVVWQSHNHPEVQPLVDWSCVKDNAQQIFDHENAGNPPLNDQYAEIEQVRQAIKITGGNDSNHTADAMEYAFMGACAARGGAKDHVNHPSHYTQGKIECIDALESATIGKSGIEAVCVANVIKYLWRYEEKNGLEDVKKAQWYLERLVASMGS